MTELENAPCQRAHLSLSPGQPAWLTQIHYQGKTVLRSCGITATAPPRGVDRFDPFVS